MGVCWEESSTDLEALAVLVKSTKESTIPVLVAQLLVGLIDLCESQE